MSGAVEIRPGLCSVTFRGLAAERVIHEAAAAGAVGIEWGGDVHLPPGDLVRAAALGRMCREAGLDTPSYGSYLRLGADDEGGLLEPVLDTAEALGARNVRVWAGRTGSAEASEEQRSRTAVRLREAAEAAQQRGISLSVEFHRGTLTDTATSAAELFDRVAHANAFSYWQPVPDLGLPAWTRQLDRLQPVLSHLHVFHWRGANVRRPLAEGEEIWRALLAAYLPSERFTRPIYAFLEFVQDDDLNQFRNDMASLTRLCATVSAGDSDDDS